jgi:hypothetical protein
MPTLDLQFQLSSQNLSENTVRRIQDALQESDIVEDAEIDTEGTSRIAVGDVVTWLGATVMIVSAANQAIRSTADLIEALDQLMQRLRELLRSSAELAQVFVDFRGRRIPLDQLSRDDLQALAEADDASG